MVKTYDGRSGFQFHCECECPIATSFDRLAKNGTFECQGCGSRMDVPNAATLSDLGKKALAALLALRKEADRCPVNNTIVLFGLCRLDRVS